MSIIHYLFLCHVPFQSHDKGRKQVGVCFYIQKPFCIMDFFLNVIFARYLPSCQSSPLIVVLSAVMTSISWFSETGVRFQGRIWKIVQSFFSLYVNLVLSQVECPVQILFKDFPITYAQNMTRQWRLV